MTTLDFRTGQRTHDTHVVVVGSDPYFRIDQPRHDIQPSFVDTEPYLRIGHSCRDVQKRGAGSNLYFRIDHNCGDIQPNTVDTEPRLRTAGHDASDTAQDTSAGGSDPYFRIGQFAYADVGGHNRFADAESGLRTDHIMHSRVAQMRGAGSNLRTDQRHADIQRLGVGPEHHSRTSRIGQAGNSARTSPADTGSRIRTGHTISDNQSGVAGSNFTSASTRASATSKTGSSMQNRTSEPAMARTKNTQGNVAGSDSTSASTRTKSKPSPGMSMQNHSSEPTKSDTDTHAPIVGSDSTSASTKTVSTSTFETSMQNHTSEPTRSLPSSTGSSSVRIRHKKVDHVEH